MRITNPSFEIWAQEPGLDGMYRQIERVGRVCYKSENHQTADSARPFVERMMRNQHYAMLEHGTVYLLYADDEATRQAAVGEGMPWQRYMANKFSRVNCHSGKYYITTNLRVLAENQWMDDLGHICEPLAWHERRVAVHFTTQVAITREFNRHRADSMAEQSTRYCNYSKAKFGNEISVNLPVWVRREMEGTEWETLTDGEQVALSGQRLVELARKVADGTATAIDNWLFANVAAEKAYMNLVEMGHKAQEARVVLPLDTNTELVHTAFVSDWKHFFDLRAIGVTGMPHPDAKALAAPLHDAFKDMGLL